MEARAPWAWLTVGFGEASHRDWLETQACRRVHHKQGHCADRQLVQLQDKAGASPQLPGSPPPRPAARTRDTDPSMAKRGLAQHQSRPEGLGIVQGNELPRAGGMQGGDRQAGLQETKVRVIKALFSASTSLGAHRRRAHWVMRVCCPNEQSGEQPRVLSASGTPSFFLQRLPREQSVLPPLGMAPTPHSRCVWVHLPNPAAVVDGEVGPDDVLPMDPH